MKWTWHVIQQLKSLKLKISGWVNDSTFSSSSCSFSLMLLSNQLAIINSHNNTAKTTEPTRKLGFLRIFRLILIVFWFFFFESPDGWRGVNNEKWEMVKQWFLIFDSHTSWGVLWLSLDRAMRYLTRSQVHDHLISRLSHFYFLLFNFFFAQS